ncbi:DEAD-domain-containing protein [Hesseltinella vesiculosa]|uniref:RNA helicase n=1 Tax=Hesseltinella vesiculosa TaxID=101127 RepID=A0A1X2GMP3_9FUNG|nr:DEAD-domain-containing protein [Hesseltinella vesiculosa]
MSRPLNRSHDVQIDKDIDFSPLIHNQYILQGLEKSGYARPSPIQLKAIPLGRLGVDLIAQAKSGTGKTVVFGVIALEAVNLNVKGPQVLMVAPTREIAVQICDVVQNLGQCMPGFHCSALIGGLPMQADQQRLQHSQVLVGTPGRLMALLSSQKLPTNTINLFVMDEADKLMSDTFRPQIDYIYSRLPLKKQSVAFSATFTDALLASLNKFVVNPHTIHLTQDVPTLEEVQQYQTAVQIDTDDAEEAPYLRAMKVYKAKYEAIGKLLSKVEFYQCMVFTNSFSRSVELAAWLTKMGWKTGYISSGLTQAKRLKVMEDMRQFNLRVLVCSDLIARGIDIDRVNLVINVDYPRDVETYLHRIGRSGRYGTSGIAVNLVATEDDRAFLGSLLDNGISLPPLPENIKYGDFTKELDTKEGAKLQRHLHKRVAQEVNQPMKMLMIAKAIFTLFFPP